MKLSRSKLCVLTALVVSLLPDLCQAQDDHRLILEGLFGPSIPVASSPKDLNVGVGFLIGAGVRLGPSVAGLVEFQYDHLSLTSNTLAALNQAGGYGRIWSVTMNPRYYIRSRSKWGGYLTAGYGLYSQNLTFTAAPQEAGNCEASNSCQSSGSGTCDPDYGCGGANFPVAPSTTNYKGGFNAGGGVTYEPGKNGLKVAFDFRYNRIQSNVNNQFAVISVGVLY